MSVPAESDVFRTLTQKASEAIGPRNACLGVAQGTNDGRASYCSDLIEYRLVRGLFVIVCWRGWGGKLRVQISFAFQSVSLRMLIQGNCNPQTAPRQNLVDRLNRQFVIRGVVTFNSPLPIRPRLNRFHI